MPQPKKSVPRAKTKKKAPKVRPPSAEAAPRAPAARKAAAKATEIVHAPAQSASLTKEEKRRVAEAVRVGEEARKGAEAALSSFGQWLLVNVFDDDTTEAIEHKRANRVWQELQSLAGGPRLRLSRTSLHLALQVAAYDKRLNDETFRALDMTRKRVLLPLADDRRIRDAAQHVVSMKLTATSAQEYVHALLAGSGQKAPLRMTPKTAGARVERAAKPFVDRATLGKWKAQLADLEGAPRNAALTQLRSVAKAVAELIAALQTE